MTLAEVKQFLRDNAEKDAEVKAYLAELSKVSPDAEDQIIKNFKNSQEFKSERDREITKAINTYNEKTVPTLIEKETEKVKAELENKYNPPKNPAEENMRKKLEELETKYRESENKIIRESIKTAKQNILSEMGLPIELADAISVSMDKLTVQDVEDKEKLKSLIAPSIEPIAKFAESVKISKANEMLTGSANKPRESNSAPTAKQLTKEDLKNMTPQAINEARAAGQLDNILGR